MVPGAGAGTSPGVPARRSGRPPRASTGTGDPVRPVVPGTQDRGRIRPGGDAAGAGDGGRVLPVHRRGDAALASDHGSGGRNVAAALGQFRCGAARVVVGQRGRDRTPRSVDRSGDSSDGHAGFAAGATQTL